MNGLNNKCSVVKCIDIFLNSNSVMRACSVASNGYTPEKTQIYIYFKTFPSGNLRSLPMIGKCPQSRDWHSIFGRRSCRKQSTGTNILFPAAGCCVSYLVIFCAAFVIVHATTEHLLTSRRSPPLTNML